MSQVKLTDGLMSNMSWRAAGDAELAWLCALVTAPRAREPAPHLGTGENLLFLLITIKNKLLSVP